MQAAAEERRVEQQRRHRGEREGSDAGAMCEARGDGVGNANARWRGVRQRRVCVICPPR